MPATQPTGGRSRRLTIAGLTAVTAATLLMMTWAVLPNAASADPPGNNGTIKVDGVEFDSHPDNEPHVGCTFQIDFYGYDEGDLFAGVTFESQPPTTPSNVVVLTDTVFIGEDDNSGGGSEAGLDASVTYTLDLTGFTPHEIQGFHIKLTINADGSQGADVKHKVFWVTGCGQTTTTTPPTTTTTETTTTPTETTTTPTETTTTTTPPYTTTTTTSSPTVSPTSITTTPTTTTPVVAPTTVRPRGTAFTGVENVVPLGAIALALLTGGSGLLWAGRRRSGDDGSE